MKDNQPAILIGFDRQTWDATAVFFKSSSDYETKRLQEILRDGLQTELLKTCGRADET